MTLYYDTFDTPLGLFSAACNSAGAVVATAFGDKALLCTRISRSRRHGVAPGDNAPLQLARDAELLTPVRLQVHEYFHGTRRNFALPRAANGSDFQQRVWTALRDIPFGETRSYGQIARELGLPQSARAVGRANATNPLCLIVPCHRVIGGTGALTGFAFGEPIKRALLEHEQAIAARLPLTA